MANGPNGLAAILRAPGLRGVFDQYQLVFVGECFQHRQVAWIAAQVNCDDGFRFRSDPALHVSRI